jgi:thioredoxin reductase
MHATKLLAYPNVTFIEGRVASAQADGAGGFVASLDDGDRQLSAGKLLLAFGVQDGFPDGIAGVRERWGTSVLHCPYCHGYEFSGRRLGVLVEAPHPPDHAMLIAEWGPTTLFLNGNNTVDDEVRAKLQARGVTIEPGRIAALEGPAKDLPACASRTVASCRSTRCSWSRARVPNSPSRSNWGARSTRARSAR